MSVTSVSNDSLSYYQKQLIQQNQQQTDNSSTSVGAAATLDLSTSSSVTATSSTSQSSSGGSGGTGSTSQSSSCPLGNATCSGCGQCGKITAAKQNQLLQSNASNDYQTLTAINSYDANSIFL